MKRTRTTIYREDIYPPTPWWMPLLALIIPLLVVVAVIVAGIMER